MMITHSLTTFANAPDYTGCTNTNNQANIKVTHGMALKQRNDVVNMNTALIDAFLDLVPVAFIQSNKQIWMENPNSSVFREMFDWFVMKYSRTSTKDRKTNCIAMVMEWHPMMGLKL